MSFIHALYVSVWAPYGTHEGLCTQSYSSWRFHDRGYTTEEVIECYADYIKDGKPIGVPVSWHHGRLSGKETKGAKSIIDVTYKRVQEAHFSIMH
jgi:hypothetical protein